MMKKILPDMLMVGLVLAVALCLAAAPSPLFSSPTHALKQLAARTKPTAKSPWHPPVSKVSALKGRNLFLATETDTAPGIKSGIPLSQKPYLLEAILLGQEEQAIFRQNTGEILALTTGQALIDGAMVIGISPRSVKLKKGEKIETMLLFDIQARRPATVARINEKKP